MKKKGEGIEKCFYRIREVAAMLDVAPSTLRFWEHEFEQWLKPTRNAAGSRFYTPADVDTLRTIRYLLHEKGLHIDAARRQMSLNRDVVDRRREALDSLAAMRKTVKGLLDALEKRR